MRSMGAKTSQKRSPGRPAKARGDQRDRLLEVALTLFSRNGVAETPLSALARRGRVPPALMNYHYGNRWQLHNPLMAERLAPKELRLGAQLPKAGCEPAARVRAFATSIMTMLAENPCLPPLWVRELLTYNSSLRERLM